MKKFIWANVSFLILNVFLVFIVLLAFLTQFLNFQLIAIQKIYGSLDSMWVIFRIVGIVIIFFGGIAVLFLNRTKAILNRSYKLSMIFVLLGLFFGLSVFYGYSCCDTPVTFLMGFPFSWLRGISDVQHSLPSPSLVFLLQNVYSINWRIDYFSFLIDAFFWYNVGLICWTIRNR